jgi:hypothetical protein
MDHSSKQQKALLLQNFKARGLSEDLLSIFDDGISKIDNKIGQLQGFLVCPPNGFYLTLSDSS